ncbi:MAG: type IV toxin-antitoxin system AbiEi family antitoxin domain-containing protein [Acidimicrobiales bacterium]
MTLADTYRRQLRDLAFDQYGYVTTRDADELDVPPVELRKLAARGGLEHVGRGVYRFEEIPKTACDEYMEAVLLVGRDAYLTHDAVLALHDLGLVNPRRIRVGTPHRVRTQLPDRVEMIRRDLDPADLTRFEGVPTTTVARALVDCRDLVMGERLVDAAQEAAERGLLTRREGREILADLGASA